MKDAIIFDLDGTLLNTLEDLTDATNYTLTKFGLPTRTIDEVCSFVGNGVLLLIKRAVPGGTQHPNFNNIFETFKNYYEEHSLDKTKPYDGVTCMLKTAKERGYKTAIVSNKIDSAVKHLKKIFFDTVIDVAYGERPDIKKKPASDAVFAAMRDLCTTPDRCVYVGDSDVDIMTAKNSGVDCISVSWGFRSREFLIKNGAKVIIDQPMDLFSHIT